jgi:hypothetical protein
MRLNLNADHEPGRSMEHAPLDPNAKKRNRVSSLLKTGGNFKQDDNLRGVKFETILTLGSQIAKLQLAR